MRRLEEACELIRRLWLEPVARFAGRYYQLHEAYCAPKPVQQPHPPVAIGAAGERTLRVAACYAQIGDCSVATVEEYRQKSAAGQLLRRDWPGSGQHSALQTYLR